MSRAALRHHSLHRPLVITGPDTRKHAAASPRCLLSQQPLRSLLLSVWHKRESWKVDSATPGRVLVVCFFEALQKESKRATFQRCWYKLAAIFQAAKMPDFSSRPVRAGLHKAGIARSYQSYSRWPDLEKSVVRSCSELLINVAPWQIDHQKFVPPIGIYWAPVT